MQQNKIQWSVIAPCLLAIAVDAMGFGLGYPVISALFSQGNSHFSQLLASVATRDFYLGVSYMIYPLGMFFGAVLMGDLSDNFGRKKILAVCLFGLGISYALMGFGALTYSLSILIVGRGLSGLMAGCQPIAQASISDLSTPETKALNMSFMSVAFSMGIILGPIIGGVTSDHNLLPVFDYDIPFFLTAFLSFIGFIWLLISYKETFHQVNKPKMNLFKPISLLYAACKHKDIRLLSISFFFMQIGYSLYFQMVLILLQTKYSYSALKIGIFSGFIGIFFVIGLVFITRYMLKIWPTKTNTAIGLFIAGISQCLLIFCHTEVSIWLLAIPIAAFDMVAYTTILTCFSDVVPPNKQGWALGVSSVVMAIAWAFTGLFTNIITLWGLNNIILIGGVCWIISFCLMLVFCKAKNNKLDKKFCQTVRSKV